MEPATSTIVTPEIIIPAIVFPTPDIVTPDNRGKYRNFTASFKLAAVEEATITSIRLCQSEEEGQIRRGRVFHGGRGRLRRGI